MAHKLERARKKVVGEPYEGKPHVRFDVAGNGNQDAISQAPFLDPTRRPGLQPEGKHREKSENRISQRNSKSKDAGSRG